MKKDKLLILAIFLLSFGLRIYCAFSYNEPLSGDQIAYDHLALTFLREHQFATVRGPTAYITPLYPFFLSVVYFFFGHNYLYARIVQALLGALVCLIVYFATREIFSKPVAVLAFFFMSIHYFFIRYGMLFLSENLFIFWVALSALFLVKFFKTPSYLHAALFGLFCSLATLTRSAYFLFPFMILTIFFLPNFIHLAYRRLIKFSLAMMLCFLLPISAWTLRNYLLFKTFIPLGTEAGIVLYSSYTPLNEKILGKCTQDEVTWSLEGMSEAESSRFLLKHTLLAIKKEPSKLYRYIPLKLMYFFSVFDWAAFRVPGTYNLSTGFILPLAFMGIILIWRKQYSYANLVVLLPVIYFLLVTISITGTPRTRLPVEPYLIIYAAFWVDHIYTRSRFKLITVCSVIFWYAINYLFYLNSQDVKMMFRTFFEKIGLW